MGEGNGVWKALGLELWGIMGLELSAMVAGGGRSLGTLLLELPSVGGWSSGESGDPGA